MTCQQINVSTLYERLDTLTLTYNHPPVYLKHACRADSRLAVRICWHYHHCDYCDLRWVLWNSSGPFSLLAVLLFTGRACPPVGVQKSQGANEDKDEGEDDSPLRLTAEDAWTFPVVCSFYFALRACRKKLLWSMTARFNITCRLVSSHQVLRKGMDQLASVALLCTRWSLQRTTCNISLYSCVFFVPHRHFLVSY